MAASLAGSVEKMNAENWSSHERRRSVKARIWLCSLTPCTLCAAQDQSLLVLTTVWKIPEEEGILPCTPPSLWVMQMTQQVG